MKVNKLWAALLATSFGLAATMTPTLVEAQGGKKKKTEAPIALTGPATTSKPVKIPLDTLKWGMTVKEVALAVDKVLDEDYKPLYAKTSPGVKMKQLDAALGEGKNEFRRSRLDFGKLPLALDSSPLKGEYSYMNKESMMSLTRNGETLHMFFIQDRLWKIIQEVKFSEKGPYGKTFPEAAVKLSTMFGVPGRVIPPNEAKGIFITEVDWKDATTHVRLIERSDTGCAIAYEDNATLGNLNSLRANKPVVEDAIDPAVAAAIRGPDPDPTPPAAAAKDNKKK